jgi:hypothetical protein
MRAKILAAASAVAMSLASAALAQPLQQVTSYLGQTVRTYNKDGSPNGEIPANALPKTPAPIVGADDKGHPGVQDAQGKIIYLKPADILIKGASVCKEMQVAAAGSDRRQALSPLGVKAGAAENSVPCIPERKP